MAFLILFFLESSPIKRYRQIIMPSSSSSVSFGDTADHHAGGINPCVSSSMDRQWIDGPRQRHIGLMKNLTNCTASIHNIFIIINMDIHSFHHTIKPCRLHSDQTPCHPHRSTFPLPSTIWPPSRPVQFIWWHFESMVRPVQFRQNLGDLQRSKYKLTTSYDTTGSTTSHNGHALATKWCTRLRDEMGTAFTALVSCGGAMRDILLWNEAIFYRYQNGPLLLPLLLLLLLPFSCGAITECDCWITCHIILLSTNIAKALSSSSVVRYSKSRPQIFHAVAFYYILFHMREIGLS